MVYFQVKSFYLQIINIQMSQIYKEQIKQNSEQWLEISYILHSLSANSAVKIVQIFKYPQKQSISFQSKNKFDAVVDITDLNKEYKNKVVDHSIPCQDIIFHCGHINIQKQKIQPSKILRYLICKVSLGVIGNYKQSSNHLDSILVQPEDEDDPFHFNFLVKNHNQYEANYQVSFIIDHQNNQNVNLPIFCSNCQKMEADVYYKEEEVYYCKSCQDKVIQEKNYHKSMMNSTRKVVPPLPPLPQTPNHTFQSLNRINTLPFCDSHKTMFELYCLKCQKYVCSVCIQKGTHSQSANHVLKPVEFVFNLKSEENVTVGVNHLSKLQTIYGSVAKKAKEITKNFEDTKKRLTNEFQRSLLKLQHLYKEKILKIWSNEIQITFLKQKIKWQKAIIAHFQNILRPINYFKLQTRFCSKINGLKVDGFQNTFTINPTIDCYIDVLVDEKQEIQGYIETKKRTSMISPINSMKSHRSQFGKSDNLLRYDEKNDYPKKGDLHLMLENSNLHFFKIAPSQAQQKLKT